ncbi:MAG: FKBP-type peptidyl-prolyl cis-trans isomerase [Syntrophobacteraceae bacterium]|jgi:FKBP-type peptidyl-prolyl cis-trans isomerase|nr:FKBP-type peptidyl-prolyl cis-trans isomerase [Syntrophobacteraceae bacterium]
MKILVSIVLSTFLLLGQTAAAEERKAAAKPKASGEKTAAEPSKAKAELKTNKEKLSYTLGYDVGRRIKQNAVELDMEVFVKAFRDGMSGREGVLSEEEMKAALVPLQEEMKTRRVEDAKKKAEQNKELSEKNKAAGATFLAETAKKEGVVTLPSGLLYKVVKEGAGKTPQKTDTVAVNYRGTLIDGTEFDSSYKRGQPAEFGVDKVIKGWTEALQLMKEGSQWTLFVPSDLAYGERGAGKLIGPGQTLIFDVELLTVKEPTEAPKE